MSQGCEGVFRKLATVRRYLFISILISMSFLSLDCKKSPSSSPSSAASNAASSQCYVAPTTQLALAETYTAPAISTMTVDPQFPNTLSYTSDQVYDHAQISICASGNTCQQSYSFLDSAVLIPEKLGALTVKLQLCFNTTCGAEKTTQINNTTALSADQSYIATRLQAIDASLLSLAQQRLSAEGNSPLTPYTFLRTFEELYINQPDRLALANTQCGYSGGTQQSTSAVAITSGSQTQVSMPTSTASTVASVTTKTQAATVIGTETSTGTDTSTTLTENQQLLAEFKTAAQYMGYATTVLSFIILGKNIYQAVNLEKKLDTKLQMFTKIELAIKKYTEAIKEVDANYDKAISGLVSDLEVVKINPKYAEYFSSDEASEKLLEDVQSSQKKIEDAKSKINQIKKDTAISPADKRNQMGAINTTITTEKKSLADNLVKVQEQKPNKLQGDAEVKKQYAVGVGKFLGGIAISGGLLAVGYSLAGGDASLSIKNIDAQIYVLLVEKSYLLAQL